MDAKSDANASANPTPRGPLEVADACWMIGHRNPSSLLQCNTYLRTFASGNGPLHVCVDPGSQFDFSVIEDNIDQLIGGVSELHAFSVNHQDPDVIGNAEFLCNTNPNLAMIVTEDVWRLAQHLLLNPKQIKFANPVRSEMTIGRGRSRWKLVPTPFCHFRGAMAFYDPEIQTLFSGDLFGGLNRVGRVQLIAEEGDWDGIAQFHQIYMPTREVLRYAVRQIRALDPPVKVIAPQHGYVIEGSLVEVFLERMHELLVGSDLLASELDVAHLDGYREVLARVIAYAKSVLGRDEVLSRLATRVDDGLDELIRVHGKDVVVDREGYTAIVKAVARIAWRESMEFSNNLRSEVLAACTDHGLPIPPVGSGLEEGLSYNFLSPDEVRARRTVPVATTRSGRPHRRRPKKGR